VPKIPIMPITPKQQQALLAKSIEIETEIARHPDGAGVDALLTALATSATAISKRTLQRRLGDLLRDGRIVREGRGPSTRYRLPPVSIIYSRPADGWANSLKMNEPIRAEYAGFADDKASAYSASAEISIPISSEGSNIRDYVRQAIQQRQPVGYDRALLEGYQPNVDYYLDHATRAHLNMIGRRTNTVRPAGTYARDLLARLLIDLSWASSRLEGNTYTRLDTQNLIERGQAADGKDRLEAQMILNHKNAIEMLVQQTGDETHQIGFNTYTFFNLHALLSENLLSDPRESGRLRMRNVEVSGTVFMPLSIPQQIDQLFRLMLTKADAIVDPFEQAFFTMVHSPYLQPFIDVNKRVSRLAANIPLIRHNLCPLSFVDVPGETYIDGILGVYELKRVALLRDVFVWAYERSCQRYAVIRDTTAEPDPIRLRYREDMIAVIVDIVRNLRASDAATVNVLAAISLPNIPQIDLQRVVDFILEDLQNLYEGNVARYRLRVSEYDTWAAKNSRP
jgi:hypothetical protein